MARPSTGSRIAAIWPTSPGGRAAARNVLTLVGLDGSAQDTAFPRLYHPPPAVLARRPANRAVRRCGEEQRLGLRHRPRQHHTGDRGPLPRPDVDQGRPAGGEQGAARAARPGAARPPTSRGRRKRCFPGTARSDGGGWMADGRLVLERQGDGIGWDIMALDLATRQVTAVRGHTGLGRASARVARRAMAGLHVERQRPLRGVRAWAGAGRLAGNACRPTAR